MYRPFKMALLFIALMSVLTLTPILVDGGADDSSPYISGLSDLAFGSVMAAKPSPNPCDRTECVTSTSRICQTHIATECKFRQGTCTTLDCN